MNSKSKILTGAVIGGISALAVFLLYRKKETTLEEVGKIMSDVGDILENHQEHALIKDSGKPSHHHETGLSAAAHWVATGICLWKKFKT